MNQTPEQISRDNIDKQLNACGWAVQSKKKINLSESLGVAVREYQTDVGPADYVLFVNKKPVGIIEAKEENKGFQFHHGHICLNFHHQQIHKHLQLSV